MRGPAALPWAPIVALILVVTSACESPSHPASTSPTTAGRPTVLLDEREVRLALTMSPVPSPLLDETNAVVDDPRAARLGQRLFFDGGLSRDGSVSCASCHDPALAFADGRPLSEGLGTTTRNAPTLLNSAHLRWYFWDGRADSAWSQALAPLESDVEMGGDRTAIARHVARDSELRDAYEDVFGALPDLDDGRVPPRAHPRPDTPDHPEHRAWLAMSNADRAAVDRVFANVGKAIAAYERRLTSRDSAFDRFVRGLREGDADDLAALSPAAQRGLSLFLGRAGCRQCHFGPLLSDGEFHNIGAPPGGDGRPRDPGRYDGERLVLADPFNSLGDHSDDRNGPRARTLRTLRRTPDAWGAFKTPSLRNVAATAPYMQVGQLPDLRAVLHFYSTLEGAVGASHHGELVLTPFELSPQETDDLIAFLESLTDVEVDPSLRGPPAPR